MSISAISPFPDEVSIREALAKGTLILTATQRLSRHLTQTIGARDFKVGRVPTILPVDAWLVQTWRSLSETHKMPPYDVKNLFASIGSSGRHLAFAGHTDVVPAGNEESWRFPPFSATIEDDKLYGRGTEDMKSNIACFMSATNKFIDKYGKDFGGIISFIITGDEEGQAINGTPKIMEWTS